jgi:hypothetical protein
MNTLRSIVVSAALLTLPAEAQDHRFETDPIVTVRENFVACDVLSQLQRVMDNPRFLLVGECEPLPAGHRLVSTGGLHWPHGCLIRRSCLDCGLFVVSPLTP